MTVNTAYSKYKPKRVDFLVCVSLGSCWKEWLQKHQGQVTWMITFRNSQPAELFVQRSPFVMSKRTDVCRQEWPNSSRLCANFVTISVEPLLCTPSFYRNPAQLRVHVIGRSEAQTSQTRRHAWRRSHPRSGAKGKLKNLRNLHRMQHVWSPAVSLFWKTKIWGALVHFTDSDDKKCLQRDLSSFALWHFLWK